MELASRTVLPSFLLPSDVQLLIANEYLIDRDADAWARTSRMNLIQMKQYSIKREMRFSCFGEEDRPLHLPWGVKQLQRLASTATATGPHEKSDLEGVQNPGGDLEPSGFKTRFGVVSDLHLRGTLSTDELQALLDACPRLTALALTIFDPMPELTGIRFPTKIKYLSIMGSLTPESFPSKALSATSVNELHVEFTHRLSEYELPPSLTKLSCQVPIDSSLDGANWPPALLDLALFDFNSSLEEADPSTSGRSRCLLPPTLTALKFNEFNQRIDRVQWPADLRTLDLGIEFNQPLEGVLLPPNLTFLEVGLEFSYPLVQWTPPPKLEVFKFMHRWYGPASDLRLPDSIRKLDLPSVKKPYDGWMLPANLESLRLSMGATANLVEFAGSLPVGLKELTLDLVTSARLRGVRWPPNLTSLQANLTQTGAIAENDLPPSLLSLKASCYDEDPHWLSRAHFPASLTRLDLSDASCAKLQHTPSSYSLPNQLHTLSIEMLDSREAQALSRLAPRLRELMVRVLELPANLESDSGDNGSSMPPTTIILPESLQVFSVSHEVNGSLNHLQLPLALEKLILEPQVDDLFELRFPNTLRQFTVHADSLIKAAESVSHLTTLLPPTVETVFISCGSTLTRKDWESMAPPNCRLIHNDLFDD